MTSAGEALRPVLYGDVPLDRWPLGDDHADEPWASFVRARHHLAAGDQDLAVRAWSVIAHDERQESRNRLQAWHFLRSIDVHPDEELLARRALGVVVEVPVDGGHDVLAAYAMGGVRYLDHAGGATVIEEGTGGEELLVARAALLAAGQALADALDPWTGGALPGVPPGHTRLLVLTPGGHRFGQGPDGALRQDPLATAVFSAATDLLVAVVGVSSP